jgi:hypothetical protein
VQAAVAEVCQKHDTADGGTSLADACVKHRSRSQLDKVQSAACAWPACLQHACDHVSQAPTLASRHRASMLLQHACALESIPAVSPHEHCACEHAAALWLHELT